MRYLLNNPYHTQRNNKIAPASTCNVTAMIMALRSSGVEFVVPVDTQPEDHLAELLNSETVKTKQLKEFPTLGTRPAREIHDLLSWGTNYLLCHRVVSRFTLKADLRLLLWRIAALRSGAVVAGRFTTYGHMVALVGFEYEGEIPETWLETNLDLVKSVIIDDPWGNIHSDYRDHNGNNVELTLAAFNHYTREYDHVGKKWAHIIDPTGRFEGL